MLLVRKNKDKAPIILFFGEYNTPVNAEIVVRENREPYYNSSEQSPEMIRRAYFQSEEYRKKKRS